MCREQIGVKQFFFNKNYIKNFTSRTFFYFFYYAIIIWKTLPPFTNSASSASIYLFSLFHIPLLAFYGSVQFLMNQNHIMIKNITISKYLIVFQLLQTKIEISMDIRMKIWKGKGPSITETSSTQM